MARSFSGISQSITCSTGALASTVAGGITVLTILKLGSTSGGIFQLGTTTSAGKVDFQVFSGDFYFETDDTNASTVLTASTADNWTLVGATKATGSVKPRGHKYVYDTATWTHADGPTSVPNASGSAGAGGVVQIGAWETSDYFSGDIAVMGVWLRVMTDTEIENLAFSLQAWYGSAPDALWVLDQSATTQNVLDLSGGGANQSALGGTSVSTNSVPVFSYGFDISALSSSASTGSSTVNGTATIAGAGALSSAVVQGVIAAPTGAGTVTAPAVQAATASLTGAGTLTSPAVQGVTASPTGAGTLTSAVVQQATASPTGAGVLSATSVSTISGTATITGAGALAAAATQQAVASLAGAGALTAVGTVPGGGAATITGAGTVTATATQGSGATIIGAGTLSGTVTQNGKASPVGAGALAASGVIAGTAALAGVGALTVTVQQLATATLAGSGGLVAVGGLPDTGVSGRLVVSTAGPTMSPASASARLGLSTSGGDA